MQTPAPHPHAALHAATEHAAAAAVPADTVPPHAAAASEAAAAASSAAAAVPPAAADVPPESADTVPAAAPACPRWADDSLSAPGWNEAGPPPAALHLATVRQPAPDSALAGSVPRKLPCCAPAGLALQCLADCLLAMAVAALAYHKLSQGEVDHIAAAAATAAAGVAAASVA